MNYFQSKHSQVKILCLISIFVLLNMKSVFPRETPGEMLSQDTTTEISSKDLLKDANQYFKNENFLFALPLYLELDKRKPSIEYKYNIGVCYLYKTDEKQKSIEYLEQVVNKKPKTENLYFYLGRAYHLNYRFEDAIEYLNNAKNKKTSEKNAALIDRCLENAENGRKLVEDPVVVRIENIGPPINTVGHEYVPVISADESILMFTYRGEKSTGGLQNKFGDPDPKGKYFEDILMSVKLGWESWSEPEGLGGNINIRGHDACLGLAADGQKLFVYKDTEGTSGDIYVSELSGFEWGDPVRLDTTINTIYWEGNASLSANKRTLFFSSEKPGGFGGRDIYQSFLNDDGTWGQAVNIGPVINTPYDDDSPFIHADDKLLYFSSQGHNSMGGFDIFVSRLQDDGSWSASQNIGYPISTTDDDRFYVVSADGERGYYSSAKLGGYGQQDIYIVHPDPFSKEHILMLIKGDVTADDQPAGAKITVTYGEKKKPFKGNYKSNSATGKYIVILQTGTDYEITFTVKGFPPHVEKVDANNIHSYKEIVRDIKIYSPGYFKIIKIDAKLLLSEEPDVPAANIAISIRNNDGSISKTAMTDDNGNFTLDSLPADQHYTFFYAEETKAIIKGFVFSGSDPKQGLLLSATGGYQTTTKEDGSFRLEISPPLATECSFPVEYLIPYEQNTKFLDFSNVTYNKILEKYGDCINNDLLFKVQIGAYYSPENFNYSYFNPLGNVSTQLLKDGITRFTIGRYKTLNQAQAIRKKAVRIGDKDSFITIFYKGERKLLSEDITKDL
ncbi:MAG: hypothetical protein ABII90_03945 [Bacteroidota bacterium]